MSAEGSVDAALSWSEFRSQFPVLDRCRYLNAGTEDPVPRAAVDAVSAQLESALQTGRIGSDYLDATLELAAQVRAGYARVMGAPTGSVALTESTTAGINSVLAGLRFAPGDEILTSDQEHPGLLAPLRRLSVLYGVAIRVAPFASIAAAVTPTTRLIACSHVSWVGGEVADVPALVGSGVPVLLDAAQALGAIPVDVMRMGVDYYAASGQKWLCGPEGSGALYVRPDRLEALEPAWPGYAAIANHDDVLGSELATGTGRLDTGFPPAIRSAWALASLRVFEAAGWGWMFGRASFMASLLATGLAERGLEVAPRGASTLVAWMPRSAETAAEVARYDQAQIRIRSIPGRGLLRASCGAWTSEEDVAALLAAAS